MLGSDFPLKPRVSPDSQDLRFGELGLWVALAADVRSVRYSIGMIASGSIPAQVGKNVIGWVSVIVAAVHPRRPWADEGAGHKALNKPSSFLPVLAQA